MITDSLSVINRFRKDLTTAKSIVDAVSSVGASLSSSFAQFMDFVLTVLLLLSFLMKFWRRSPPMASPSCYSVIGKMRLVNHPWHIAFQMVPSVAWMMPSCTSCPLYLIIVRELQNSASHSGWLRNVKVEGLEGRSAQQSRPCHTRTGIGQN